MTNTTKNTEGGANEGDVIAAFGGDLLRAWREERGLSLREFEELIKTQVGRDVSYLSIWRVEKGTNRPSLDMLDALHVVTGGKIRADHFLSPDAVAQAAAQSARASA